MLLLYHLIRLNPCMTGIGFAILYTLLAKNIEKVYVISLDEGVTEKAKEEISRELGPDALERVEFIHEDLENWTEIATIASNIRKSAGRLDSVILNASRGIMPARMNADNVDVHMSQNVFGHDVLVSHLLPLVKETAAKGDTVRIVFQSSNAHRVRRTLHIGSPLLILLL